MAYYTALINAWNNATQPPPGIIGTALTALSTANKIIAVNGWLVTSTIPTTLTVTGAQLLNCINYTEFKTLTAAQQSNLLMMCASQGPLLGGSTNAGLIAAGMFIDYFTASAGPTRTALAALAQAQPFWSTSAALGGAGLGSPVSLNDTLAAGLS